MRRFCVRKSNMRKESRYVICLLFMLQSLPFTFNMCQSTNGMNFVEHTSSVLPMTPFKSMLISYYMECLASCDAYSRCKSLNIRSIGGNKICELLDGDTTKLSLIPEKDALYFEIIMPKADSAENMIKTYCEPECKFAGICRGTIPKCRCENGSVELLQDDQAVLVRPKGDGYAVLKVNVLTGLYKIKLVHAFGVYACVPDYLNWLNNFGCYMQNRDSIEMTLTYENNTVLLPGIKGFSHDGRRTRSTFVTFNDPIVLKHGQTLRLWYREDLVKYQEADNFGSVAMYVLAMKQGSS